MLRALGVGGAGGLLAVVGQAARAADRPHERLQDRSEQRNRKQRNNKDNNQNNNNDNNNRGGGQLRSGQNGQCGPSPVCEAECQEQFDGCLEPCALNSDPAGREFCLNRCETEQERCLKVRPPE